MRGIAGAQVNERRGRRGRNGEEATPPGAPAFVPALSVAQTRALEKQLIADSPLKSTATKKIHAKAAVLAYAELCDLEKLREEGKLLNGEEVKAISTLSGAIKRLCESLQTTIKVEDEDEGTPLPGAD